MPNELRSVSADVIRGLYVLSVINELSGGRTREDVDIPELEERLRAHRELDDVILEDEVALLESRQQVAVYKTLGGLAGVSLTPSGKNAAEAFDAERNDVVGRRVQLRDDYLSWLYDQIEVQDRGPTPDDFLAAGPTYYGVPYTKEDLLKAGAWLKESAFIDGPEAWQHAAPLRPRLTAKGRWTVENGMSVSDGRPTQQVQNFFSYVGGNANIVNASHHVDQRIDASTWIDAGNELLASIEQAIPAMDVDDVEAERLAGTVREALDEKDPSKAQSAFRAIGNFLSSTGSGTLGGLLTNQITAFLTQLAAGG